MANFSVTNNESGGFFWLDFIVNDNQMRTISEGGHRISEITIKEDEIIL